MQATTTTIQFFPTATKLVSENYPYGYTLKTTKYDWIEFKKGKGFRHVSQTINPKNGRLNAPKAGTYSKCALLYKDNNGHVKTGGTDFYGNDGINKGCKFIFDNYELFTKDEINHLYSEILSTLVVSYKAQIIYCNSKKEDIQPLFMPAIEIAKEGLKSGENLFNKIVLDITAIESFKDPNYNPFKVSEVYEIGANGMVRVQ